MEAEAEVAVFELLVASLTRFEVLVAEDAEFALAVMRVWLSRVVVLERVVLFVKATSAGGAKVEPLPAVLLIPS